MNNRVKQQPGNNKIKQQSHIEFYKHLSGLSLATFGGCVTLLSIFAENQFLLLLAAYSALGATAQSLYTVKVIISEGRIPYTRRGPLTGWLGYYAPYKFLMLSLVIVAVIFASKAFEKSSNASGDSAKSELKSGDSQSQASDGFSVA